MNLNKFFRILFCKKVNINIIKDAFIGKYNLSYLIVSFYD